MLNDEMELFHKNYQKLKRLITQSQTVFEKLNLKEESLNLRSQESFRLLIMGKNRRDRINLINSLIGREFISPSDLSSSTTGMEIKWDERERSVIHFINDLNSVMNEENIFEIYDASKKPCSTLQIEIPVSKLHRYIPLNRILDNIEIFIPDSFCMDGIEIFDFPEFQFVESFDGINEISKRLVPNLILIIASVDEMEEFIDKCPSNEYSNNIFYIIKDTSNISVDERYRILYSLKNSTRFREEGIFFISSFEYDKTVNEKEYKIITSEAISDVRDAVQQEHRKESLYKPLYELTRIVKETILKIIGELYKTAEQNAQDVEMIYNRSTAAVRRALIHSENIHDRTIFFTERVGNLINEEVGEFIGNLPAKIQNHMEEPSIRQLKNTVIDVYRKIEEQVDMELYEWIKERIIPLIDASIKNIINDENYSLRSFCYEIDNINRDFGRARGIKQPAEKYVPASERFSGLLKAGEEEEINEYVKSINESLVSNVIFSKRIPVMNSKCTEKILYDNSMGISKCWDMVYDAAVKCIEENSKITKEKIPEEILNQIEAFFEYVKVKINFEIERVQNKVEYLQEYKNNLLRATDKITECERELKQIDNELTELLFETIGT